MNWKKKKNLNHVSSDPDIVQSSFNRSNRRASDGDALKPLRKSGSALVASSLESIRSISHVPNQDCKLRYLADDSARVDTLHAKAIRTTPCSKEICSGSIMVPAVLPANEPCRSKETILEDARKFLSEYYESKSSVAEKPWKKRLAEVEVAVKSSRTYDMTHDELNFAAKMAWRNAARCIGRIHWSNMKLFDARHAKTATAMFEAICTHLDYASNGGNLRPAITVFAKRTDRRRDCRVWNSQLIKYAGYRQPDGTVIGDRGSADFTEECQRLGWTGQGGMFDVLPLVLQADGQDPEWFEIPPNLVLEVHMKHPQYPWFESLGLRWYAVPAVANMLLDCGGLQYPACPFNGWYMSTEIGARDFCDEQRYNLLPLFGQRMGLDVDNITSLWKDRALVEVNIAVLYSFQKAGVTITDHHSASESFMLHMRNESRLRGGCPADWVWIVPPMSGSICPVFHQEMLKYNLRPSYEYQDDPWHMNATQSRGRIRFRTLARLVVLLTSWARKALLRRQPCTILFATETGRSEAFAMQLQDRFKYAFNPRVICMSDYNVSDLKKETLVLVVASTFREGDPPTNGESFLRDLIGKKPKGTIEEQWFSVFALGSRAYPDFCQFGKDVSNLLADLGMKKLYPLAEGDELNGQERAYLQWEEGLYKECCHVFEIQPSAGLDDSAGLNAPWKTGNFRLRQLELRPEVNVRDGLKMLHGVNVSKASVIRTDDIYEPQPDRSAFLVRLATQNDPALEYTPGDHLVVYPRNSPEVVTPILERIGETTQYQCDTPGVIEMLEHKEDGEGWRQVRRLPAPLSITTALTHFLDVTTPLAQELLAALATMATEKQDKQTLKHLAMNDSAYEQWRWEHQPTFADVLTRFPSVVPDPAFLFCQLPVLQPRFYSISSSLSCYKGEIHVTVGEVTYSTPDGHTHHGVCSTFLKHLQEDSSVICRINHAPKFRLPNDSAKPLILIGAGTGIAPYRSFWQERLVQMAHRQERAVAPISLYHGCRSSGELPYGGELADMERVGVIDTHIAFSRQPDTPKIYVQDLLRQDGEEVVDVITKQSGEVYVCGDVTVSSAVSQTLVELLEKHSFLDRENAKQFIRLMKQEDRFHEDIFSSNKPPPGPMVPMANDPPPSRKGLPRKNSSQMGTNDKDQVRLPSLRRHVKSEKKFALQRGATYLGKIFPKWNATKLDLRATDSSKNKSTSDPYTYFTTAM